MGRSFTRPILITGGLGFIGSHWVVHLQDIAPQTPLIIIDKISYASHPIPQTPQTTLIPLDLLDQKKLTEILQQERVGTIFHFAAESHVDRSIQHASPFITSNIVGTSNLLNALLTLDEPPLFYHISTDEVFGSLPPGQFFTETSPYNPLNPYSASKAAADHLVQAFAHTHNIPTLLSYCSNNYGSFQYPEKLLPKAIRAFVKKLPMPVYGDGNQQRDWIHVDDHIRAIDTIFTQAPLGETFVIGSKHPISNIQLLEHVADLVDEILQRPPHTSRQLLTRVTDRKGHDRRYGMDCKKLQTMLSWSPSLCLQEGLAKTVAWYLAHPHWLEPHAYGPQAFSPSLLSPPRSFVRRKHLRANRRRHLPK